MRQKYTDKQGSVVFAFESDTMIAVPQGFKFEDAKQMTHTEWKNHLADVKAKGDAKAPAPSADDLNTQIQALKGEVATLKANSVKLPKP